MWTHRRLKYSNHPDSPELRGPRSASARPRAFTLIELLVVVAIIAVLMSILLPSLRAARESARAVVCGQLQRDLGNGLQTYLTENKDWIPGINTSGVKIRRVEGLINEYYNPRMPVQSYDWITPLISMSTEMQAQRAQRFKEIMNRFACPSQRFYKTVFYPAGLAECVDSQDFMDDPDDWTPLSYLMPVHFQLWGADYEHDGSGSGILLDTHVSNPSFGIWAETMRTGWEAYHDTYKSNLNQIGNASTKIACADGTRYLAEDLLDFDPNPVPGDFGSFTSSGAWWGGSTAYGVKNGTFNWSGRRVNTGGYSPGQGRQLELSYRHGLTRGTASGSALDNRGTINAAFFDGSVRRLNDKQSRNPVFWYPKGTKVHRLQGIMINDLQTGDLIP